MEQNQSIVLTKEDFTEQSGNLYMSLRELSKRLGYPKSHQLWLVYKRNQDELEPYKGIIKMMTPGGEQNTVVFNEHGCYIISMLAKTPKAKEFRKQLANLIMELRNKNLHLVSAELVQKLERDMKALQARIRKLEGMQAVYYIAEKERLCSRRKLNMNKKQYDNIVRMLKRCLPADEIAELLAVPVWVVKKSYEIEKHGGHDFFLGFHTGKTRAEIDAFLDAKTTSFELPEVFNEN